MNRNDLISCDEMIMNVFSNIERETLEKNNKFFQSWKTIVTKINGCGQNLYEHSRIIDVKNGILLIETDHPGWTQMLQFNKKFILRGLEMYMPEMKITSLAFRIRGSNAALCGSNYEEQLRNEDKKQIEKMEKAEKVLKKYENLDEEQNTTTSSEIPENLLNIFESMRNSMLTKK